MRDNRKSAAPADRTPVERPLEQSVGYQLGRAFRRLNRAVSAAVRPYGLSAAQGNILLTLWSHGPMTIGDLQEQLGFSSSAFTGALDRMEIAGLLRRVPSPTDGRSFLVEPARWSGTRRDAVLDSLIEAENDFLAHLSPQQRSDLLALLREIGDGD